jgi:hypothetical protein
MDIKYSTPYLQRINTALKPFHSEVQVGCGEKRGVYATEDIPCSSIVLQSLPTASILLPQYFHNKCEYCHVDNTQANELNHTNKGSLSRCSGCKFFHYCSKDHQTRAWKNYHKLECKLLANLCTGQYNEAVICDVILLSRIVRQIYCRPENVTASAHNSSTNLSGCVNENLPVLRDSAEDIRLLHYDSIDSCPQSATDSHRAVVELARKLQFVPENFSINELIRILYQFQMNNFAIASEILIERAAAVYSLGALLNSSCQPNCVITYINSGNFLHLQRIVAIRHIRKGEELSHCYVDWGVETRQRQQQLSEKYYFQCQCVRCAQEPGISLDQFLTDSINTKYGSQNSKINTGEQARAKDLQLIESYKLKAAASNSTDEKSDLHKEQILYQNILGLSSKYYSQLSTELLRNYSKLFSISLLNGQYWLALQLCRTICRIYSIIYAQPANIQEKYEEFALKLLQQAAKLQGEYDSNVRWGLEARIDCDSGLNDSICGCHHSLYGLQLYTAASLYQYLLLNQKEFAGNNEKRKNELNNSPFLSREECISEALSAIELSNHIISIVYGYSHKFCASLQALYQEIQQLK